MQYKYLFLITFLFFTPFAMAAPEASWQLETIDYDTGVPSIGKVAIRAGYLAESKAPGVSFQGNILYLEGLGDSLRNHTKFLSALSARGYRVIAFDYMGQGGSSGRMNDTRLYDLEFPGLEIRSLAKIVWEKYARPDSTKKLLIGWSTGGLAALQLANDRWADSVLLIAPGVNPQFIAGDFFRISEQNLACTTYEPGKNPHVDPVKPENVYDVPVFALNLFTTAIDARFFWTIPHSVKGLVLLAGNDAFVDTAATHETFMSIAPHFSRVTFHRGCHELQNGSEKIRHHVEDLAIRFFQGRPLRDY